MKKGENGLLSEVLGTFLNRAGWSERQLANRSGVARGTIRNWMNDVVAKPHWPAIVRVASALNLDVTDANHLLAAATHPPISDLLTSAPDPDDLKLLSPWKEILAERKQDAPMLLPPKSPCFVGRVIESTSLLQLLTQKTHNAVYILSGMGGIGKTALAIHLGYQLQHHFSDGILWCRVDTSDPMSLLQLFAESYGEDVSEFRDIEGRSTAVRRILADKHALIILDNAEQSDQVVPLLPMTGHCPVLITSRQHNLPLVGATRIATHITRLEPFSNVQNAIELCEQILSQNSMSVDRSLLLEMSQLVGCLPLAVEIAAYAIAYGMPGGDERLVQQLREERMRLDALSDAAADVRAAFNISYQQLSAETQRFFATLGLFTGQDFALEAIVAVSGCDLDTSRHHLRQLRNHSLLQVYQDRYALHPLLRDFAREKTNENDWKRLVGYYTVFVEDNRSAAGSLRLEFENINGAFNIAIAHQLHDELVRGVLAYYDYLSLNGREKLAERFVSAGLNSANELNDPTNRVLLRLYLGQIAAKRGTYTQTEEQHRLALDEAYRIEDPQLISRVLASVGEAIRQQGDIEQAEQFLLESLQLADEYDQHQVMCDIYSSLSILVLNQVSDYKKSNSYIQKGVALATEHDLLRSEAMFQMNLGSNHYRLGAYKQSAVHYTRCRHLADQLDFLLMKMLMKVADASLIIIQELNYERAETCLREGLALLSDEAKQLWPVGYLYSEIALTLAKCNQVDEAKQFNAQLLQLAEKTNQDDFATMATINRGVIAGLQNDEVEAITSFSQALQMAEQRRDQWFCCLALAEKSQWLTDGKGVTALKAWKDLLGMATSNGFLGMQANAHFGIAQALMIQNKKDSDAAKHAHLSRDFWENANILQQVNQIDQWLIAHELD